MQSYSSQHWTLLSPADTSTTEHHFPFGPTASFFLELFLSSSPGAYWASSDLGGSSSGVIYFWLFIQFLGFSRQEYWSGLPFLPPLKHILSALSVVTYQLWVALHGMARSFIELCKPLHHNKAVNHEGDTHTHTHTATRGRICLQCRRSWFNYWVVKIPWRRDMLSTAVLMGFLGGSDGKESTCNAGDLGSIPGLGRSPGGGHGNLLQYSCLENPNGKGAWKATVCGVTKSWTWLSD